MEENKSYKNVVKSTVIFGGAQVIQMLITILRAKFIAIFLGSAGMGINAIFQSTLASINTFSSFGIFQSAVRDISQAKESGDSKRLGYIKSIFERLVWFTGILGMSVCIIASPLLSQFAFKNYDYTWSFILLALALPLMALANGKTVILQGTRNLTYLAKASVIGAAISLAIGIPLYYFLGVNGVVISIVLGYFLFYLTKCFYTNKVPIEKVDKLSLHEVVEQGKPIIKLGTVLMLGSLSITLFTYLTNVIIGRIGNIEDVGLFQGAASITTQSIIVIISVLASDFFPRLSAVCDDKDKVRIMVNQQLELISLIIAPIVIVLIVFAPLIVRILLSKEFMVIVPMLRWMALALLIRGIWLTMSYIILAKGDKKAYFIYDALIGNGLNFIFNILAYYYWGLQGLGISFLVGSVTVSIILFLMVRYKYGFRFDLSFFKIIFFLLMMCVFSFISTSLFSGLLHYCCIGLIIMLMFVYLFLILNKRIGLIQMIKIRIK